MDKILKPISCDKCPAVTIERGMLICTCMKQLTAKANDYNEKQKMYDSCPIGWDKEENK